MTSSIVGLRELALGDEPLTLASLEPFSRLLSDAHGIWRQEALSSLAWRLERGGEGAKELALLIKSGDVETEVHRAVRAAIVSHLESEPDVERLRACAEQLSRSLFIATTHLDGERLRANGPIISALARVLAKGGGPEDEQPIGSMADTCRAMLDTIRDQDDEDLEIFRPLRDAISRAVRAGRVTVLQAQMLQTRLAPSPAGESALRAREMRPLRQAVERLAA
jgi:hypothetical protein